MRSGNPVLTTQTFRGLPYAGQEVMTIQGTVTKTFVLLLLVLLGAAHTWNVAAQDLSMLPLYLLGGAVGGFVLAMVLVFKKQWAPALSPVYALLEGLVLGGISALADQRFPGIVIPAVGLTFATLFSLLAVYRSGLIRVTDNFRLGVVAATGGIAVFYLVQLVMSLFGLHLPAIQGGGMLGIGISLVVTAIAALNLVLDFDFIEQGSRSGAPRYMEWYGAFGLVVTLVWLYMEILRLLSRLQERR